MRSAAIETQQLKAALQKATAALLAERNALGYWEGELSCSALSTATAVAAVSIALRHGANVRSSIFNSQSAIHAGLQWLAEHQNSDGGWGDTTRSLSNISTTTLCWAAFGAAQADGRFSATVRNAERWLAGRIGVADSAFRASHSALARAIIARYGKDRTFSVPILTMCALSGRLGGAKDAWRDVIPLAFELAACPHQLFAALRLPVVSYALPALIAIGQARHVHAPSRNPFARFVRNAARERTLRVLTRIQPENGGFLEATPLTSFVTMSLAASGRAHHVVTERGLEFLLKSQRADGSWPIDTNLATWCTTLAVDALPSSAFEERSPRVPDQDGDLSDSSLQLVDWLLKQQFAREHPYTHAAPGGWAWTDLPGGVPDADDTSGALIALAKLRNVARGERTQEIDRAGEQGIRWLLGLQNRDGGIPTFCRGWGALPFDRSSADISAHAIRAWVAWHDCVDESLRAAIGAAIKDAVGFLVRTMEPRGSFAPLWFGNQSAPDEANRTYGTARVLSGICVASHSKRFRTPAAAWLHNSCVNWLVDAQNVDGGWGGEHGLISSMEETALAVEALARAGSSNVPEHASAVQRGLQWLIERVESGGWREASPIGFYFAKLWYWERLYPMIFTVAALRAAVESSGAGHENPTAQATRQ